MIAELLVAGGLARMQVVSDEWSLVLSRQRLKAGPALIELANFGEDDHDLRLRRKARGAQTLQVGMVHPGEQAELETLLPPGTYRLWCSLPGHAARGMRATLVVR